ncbi:MAG: transporter substrate-binding domain-containing protein [Tannerella sp.]|nr:transporter substrate-binding domain-containing protein [Tannerella sp.]
MLSRKLFVLYLTLLALAAGTMGVLFYVVSHPLPPRDCDDIRREGVLRIVTAYGPSGLYLAGDSTGGFQYELCRAIAQLAGIEVRLYPEMSLEKSFEGLFGQDYDIIAQNIPTTGELKESCLFTDPIVLDRQVLVQRNAAANNGVEPVRNQLALAGKTLHVPENSPVLLRLRNLQHEIGDTIRIVEDPLYAAEQLIIMVAKGDIDYAVCDRQQARAAQKQFPEIDILTDIGFTQFQSWAVRKTSPVLLDSLNHWFRVLRENGTCDRIYRTCHTD